LGSATVVAPLSAEPVLVIAVLLLAVALVDAMTSVTGEVAVFSPMVVEAVAGEGEFNCKPSDLTGPGLVATGKPGVTSLAPADELAKTGITVAKEVLDLIMAVLGF
jgi:hypothetical protein